MYLTIHDFPLIYDKNGIRNRDKKLILNFDDSKEKIIEFIKENINAINDGKRVYRKRLTKTIQNLNLLKDIELEMYEKGYIDCKKENREVEYSVYSQKINLKKYYKKIDFLNMNEIKEHIYNILLKIIDAKEVNNLTVENKKIAVKDLIKFLNIFYNNILKSNASFEVKGIFNKYQEVWFKAINKVNREIKYPLINVTNGLWRCYIITLFKIQNREDLLKELTGWNFKMLEKENITYDTKLILLSINEIFKDKQNEN